VATNRLPSRSSIALFRTKAIALRTRRATRDWCERLPRHDKGTIEEFPVVFGESRSLLWDDNNPAERDLQQGKVQNLRCAARRLHEVYVPANMPFSFWKQVGRATRRRGFGHGRLLREGCLMPAVGGGLCQLSNALYDVALQAGLKILERHAHSQIIPGSATALGRDATVAWNYIDLRFRSAFDYLWEVRLSSEELIVRLRVRSLSPEPKPLIPIQQLLDTRIVLDESNHHCATCNQKRCVHHAVATARLRTRTLGGQAFIVDESWPEFVSYIESTFCGGDKFATTVVGRNGPWKLANSNGVVTARVLALQRSIASRRLRHHGSQRLEQQFCFALRLANCLCKALTYEVEHVVVAQSLLPFLWMNGHLGGRTFSVLMTHLPLELLHRRLDEAWQITPERASLKEFRAPELLVRAETQALDAALEILTPHTLIAQQFGSRARLLPWHQPTTASRSHLPSRAVAFSAPTVARHGAWEVREAARRLDLEVVLPCRILEKANFWQGVRTKVPAEEWLQDVCCVVQPSLVEHQPRRLLQALTAGIPVITTGATGLGPQESVTVIPFGDVDALCEAISHHLPQEKGS
jgi:hypothetical protein